MLSKKINPSQFGISLYKKSKGSADFKKVFENNSKKPFIPASVTKAVTGAGLMETLGAQHRISTMIYSDGKPSSGGVYRGNLYIKGFGDPTLVSEKLWVLVNEIRKWGIKEITGDIWLDDYAFDDKTLVASRSKWNQRAYNAPITALALNWNAVRVRLVDADTALAVADPFNPYFDVKARKNFRKASQVEMRSKKGFGEKIKVSFGKDAVKEEKSFYRRVFNPRDYFGAQFKQLLSEAGISFKGKVVRGKTPENLFLVGEVKSRPLSNMLNLMMKFSNNFIADSLTKHLAYTQDGEGASFASGIKSIRDSFTKIHPFKNFVYGNASGLGRENKFTADDFSQFLLSIRDKQFYPEFLSSFPVSCIDGTLKKRICKKPGLVRAKTGLLAGVSSLAGYAKNEQGDEYVFSFFFNARNGLQFDARDSIDNFLERLL